MKSAFKSSEVFEGASKAEIIARIQQLVPPGSPEPQYPEILAALQTLTAQLIGVYQADGQLKSEPFSEVRDRTIHLYASACCRKIKGKTILITGGEGCVGGFLIKKLFDLGATKIISADNVRCHNPEKISHFLQELVQ